MKGNKAAILLIVLVVFCVLAVGLLFKKIEPGQIGVKQNLWGQSGVIAQDYGPGYHLGITGIHKWHILDRRTHFLTFTEAARQASTSSRYSNTLEKTPLEIRTTDNNTVSLDLTVTYKIQEGQAHNLVAEGLKESYADRIASKVRGTLRDELSRLRPQDLYTTELRLERVKATMPILAKSLEEYHVVPENILIRAVRFREAYEGELQAKQLIQQQTKLEESRRKVEDALKITGGIEKETEALEKEKTADWNKILQDLRSDNEVVIAGIMAEAEVYNETVRARAEAEYEKFVAEGKLALAKAEALRDGLRNAALDTAGGRILQARDAAENLNFESVTLNSNDPSVPSVIDIDALVKLLVGEPDADQQD